MNLFINKLEDQNDLIALFDIFLQFNDLISALILKKSIMFCFYCLYFAFYKLNFISLIFEWYLFYIKISFTLETKKIFKQQTHF